MTFNFKSTTKLFLLMGVVLMGTVIGCKKDNDMMDEDPIASFQFQISMANFLEVSFSNFSQNATSYTWDFGDGNTSTEENPTHTYAAAGDYTVTLTAKNDGSATSVKSTDISVTDPNELLTFIAGDGSKTWYLQREGIALGIGAALGGTEWWSLGGASQLGSRPCVLDDSWTFNRDGSIDFESNNTLFVDAANFGGWLDPAVAESCHDESEPNLFTDFASGQDVSAFANGGDYSFELDNATSTMTVNGAGFYIGLAVKTADGDNPIPVSVKDYTIFNMGEGDIADSLGVAIVATDGSFVWNFFLVSYDNPADLPDIPTTEPVADFSFVKNDFEVTFDNNSANASSYMWDFGDGASSTEENPTHTYGAEGTYTVSLTAMDAMGGSDTKSVDVVISRAVFTADVLSSATGKTWVLTGEGSYKVGPAAGSGEWWPGPAAGERLCQMDDEWTFFDDGSFTLDTKGDIWGEGYMGIAPDGCVNTADLVAPWDAFGDGTHAFTVEEGATPTITAKGTGAFIGFAKAFNGGEYDGMIQPKEEITYTVFDYSSGAGVETITLVIDIAGDGTAWWTINLMAK